MARSGLAVLAALGGAVAGFVVVRLLMGAGFYGLMIVGLGAGMGAELVRTRAPFVPYASAAIALAGMIFTEWWFRPFSADTSFGYFLTHLQDLTGVTIAFLVVGTAIAWWFPFSRGRAMTSQSKGDAQRE
ncbi:MAG: hypothetical protein U0625_06570 [Phycisphaerales bacterium]